MAPKTKPTVTHQRRNTRALAVVSMALPTSAQGLAGLVTAEAGMSSLDTVRM